MFEVKHEITKAHLKGHISFEHAAELYYSILFQCGNSDIPGFDYQDDHTDEDVEYHEREYAKDKLQHSVNRLSYKK